MDFLNLLHHFPQFPPRSFLAFFLLLLFRIGPIVGLVPFLGAKLPRPVKMGLAILLAAILLPGTLATAKEPLYLSLSYTVYCLKEVIIGLVLGFLASIPFYIAQSSGTYIDFMRGSSSLMVQDPTTQNQTSPLGVLYNYLLIVIFFNLGGPTFFFETVIDSYHVFPPDELLPKAFFISEVPLWKLIVGLATKFTALALQIGAPAIVGVLLAEVFLGIANRLAPQVQIAFLGMSIKSILAIALLWVGWFFIIKQLTKITMDWFQQIHDLFRSFHY